MHLALSLHTGWYWLHVHVLVNYYTTPDMDYSKSSLLEP